MSHEHLKQQTISVNKSAIDLTMHKQYIQTTDEFKHAVTDASGLKSTKSEMLRFLNDGNLEKLIAEK